MSIKTFADLNAAIETCVDEYVECYELDDGECHHEPTEHERFLIADAISGLIADEEFMALMRMTVTMARDSVPAFALPPAAEVQRLREALHQISLVSQNSAGSKDECGRIARRALEGGE